MFNLYLTTFDRKKPCSKINNKYKNTDRGNQNKPKLPQKHFPLNLKITCDFYEVWLAEKKKKKKAYVPDFNFS